MRAVLQRVTSASVTVDGKIIGEINKGIVVLLGVAKEDTKEDIKYLCEKIVHLRVFEDENEKMNLSTLDINGEILVVSQFTLYGDCRKGRRPSYDKAAVPNDAQNLYNEFVEEISKCGLKIATGMFQAYMDLEIHNDGPVTLILDSSKLL